MNADNGLDEPVNWNAVTAASIRIAVEQEIAEWLKSRDAARWLERSKNPTWPDGLATAISSGAYRKPAQGASE